jgi:hypothetical protein
MFFLIDDSGTATKDYSNFITTVTTGLVLDEGVKITDTIQNNEIYQVKALVANTSFSVSKPFTITESGKWNLGSLKDDDKRVNMTDNGFQKASKTIAFGGMNGNGTITTIALADTYQAVNLPTFGVNIVTEGFILSDPTAGVFTYVGLTPFQGFVSGSLGGLKTGATQDFRFAMSLNGSPPLFTAIGSTAITSVTQNPLTGTAIFNHAGTSPPIGSMAILDSFDQSNNYNRQGLVIASGATTFEVSDFLFTADDTGNFTVPIANYIPMEVKTTKVVIPLIFSADLRPGDTISMMVAEEGGTQSIIVADLTLGVF